MTLLPGDIGLTKIRGLAGKLIWLGQALNGDLSPWTHVFVVLDDDTVFEAMPGGAVITPLSEYEGRETAFVRRDLTAYQRMLMVNWARLLEGSPYNWSTYFYLAAYRFGIRPAWLKRRATDPTRMICSQAADFLALAAGDHLFDDGRLPCDVTPGDIATLL